MGAESEIDIAGRRPVSLVVIHKKVTMNFVIRKASSEDSGQVFSLVKDFATSFKPERSAFGKSFNHLIFDESALVNVCVFEGEIVAYSLAFDHYTFYANGRVTWVEEVMVREELRGKEVGRDLMKSIERWAISRESKIIGLATRRAAPFYSAIGYEDSATFFRKVVEYENG